jgi:hypothetical protein
MTRFAAESNRRRSHADGPPSGRMVPQRSKVGDAGIHSRRGTRIGMGQRGQGGGASGTSAAHDQSAFQRLTSSRGGAAGAVPIGITGPGHAGLLRGAAAPVTPPCFSRLASAARSCAHQAVLPPGTWRPQSAALGREPSAAPDWRPEHRSLWSCRPTVTDVASESISEPSTVIGPDDIGLPPLASDAFRRDGGEVHAGKRVTSWSSSKRRDRQNHKSSDP